MRRVVLAIALVGAWYWWHRSPRPTHRDDDAWQGAVLHDGFAVRYGDRVQELDVNGVRRANHELPVDRTVRVFGSDVGASAAWIKNGQLQLFDLNKREVVAAYGTTATTLCDGVGTNDARFVVGWREEDGDLWFLHGPTRSPSASSVATEVAHTAEPWCAVASAEHLIALAWRDRDRLRINWCTTKSCSALPASVKLAPSIPVVGMGCFRNACVVATRATSDAVELKYVTESGSVKWRTLLKTNLHSLSIVGIADRAFAIALPHHVVRLERDGKTSELWHGEGIPAIAWSRGRLLVAHKHGETILEVPR